MYSHDQHVIEVFVFQEFAGNAVVIIVLVPGDGCAENVIHVCGEHDSAACAAGDMDSVNEVSEGPLKNPDGARVAPRRSEVGYIGAIGIPGTSAMKHACVAGIMVKSHAPEGIHAKG